MRDITAKMNGESSPGFHKTIQNMNQALDQLEPETTSLGILIKKVQRNSNEQPDGTAKPGSGNTLTTPT